MSDAALRQPPLHIYPDAKGKNVYDLTRAELMYEVERLREQQSDMIDFCNAVGQSHEEN